MRGVEVHCPSDAEYPAALATLKSHVNGTVDETKIVKKPHPVEGYTIKYEY